MTMRVTSVETFIVTLARDTPYLGPLAPGETVNSRGYVVRKGNGTIYPTNDRSIVVRITTDTGVVGWGETYGICAPRATCEIINDLLAPVVIGANPDDVEAIWETLYGLMRVRGCTGGFHVDAIAAVDIALWDARARARAVPLSALLGPAVQPVIPGYVSGLPAASLAERVQLAATMQRDGHNSFKFAAVVSHDGIVAEMAALRAALGPDAEIMTDLHWKFTAPEALALIAALAPFRPHFVEAPVKPEDMAGLSAVCAASPVAIAAGEEWSTAYDVVNRLAGAPPAILQPEMAHTGITQFCRIAALAQDRGIVIAPHATIGIGIFLAASLHASVTLPNLWRHEWQHSVFASSLACLDTDMAYADQQYCLPTGAGLGVVPNAHFWAHAQAIA